MYTLKTTVPHRAGIECIVPFLGQVTVSEEGTVATKSLEDALGLHDSNCGYHIVGEDGEILSQEAINALRPSIEAQVVDTEAIANPAVPAADLIPNTSATDPIAPQTAASTADVVDTNSATTDSATVDRAAYEAFSVSDLKDKVKDAGFPGNEWRALTKDVLIDYMIDRKISL